MSGYDVVSRKFSLVLRIFSGVSGRLHAEWSRCLFRVGLLFGEMARSGGEAKAESCHGRKPKATDALPGGVGCS